MSDTEKSHRLLSLDAVRGLTVAGMILVNNPGGPDRYGPLGHAAWHGWTPTDLVFPSFLFIVGVAMTFSFDRRIAAGADRLRLFEHVVRRSLMLLLLGLTMYGFPDWRLIAPFVMAITGLALIFRDEPPLGWPAEPPGARVRKAIGWFILIAAIVYFAADFGYFQESRLRVVGVLQRIALCYFFASIVVLLTRTRGRAIVAAALLLGYWYLYKRYATGPVGYVADVVAPDGLLHNWIDEHVLGGHLYRERPDPEGLLSTIPAVATVLIGVLAGDWLHRRRDGNEQAAGLFVAANLLLFAGLWMNHSIPINKKIWTSSYVLLAGGISLHVLAMCYWLIDVKGWRAWARPFVVFGTNAIAVFVASGLVARLMGLIRVPTATGGVALKTWIYERAFASWAAPKNASLLFAISYVLLWLLLLLPLYRRRLFIRV